jgi:hypothetical protein
VEDKISSGLMSVEEHEFCRLITVPAQIQQGAWPSRFGEAQMVLLSRARRFSSDARFGLAVIPFSILFIIQVWMLQM